MKKTNILLICGLLLFVISCALSERRGKTDLNTVFADMEKGIRENDEQLFKKHWKSDGYDKNLVGGSGLPGREVFQQGSGKKWFPKPDLTKKEMVGSVVIVPADIWNWEREKAVDKVWFAVQTEGEPSILGGGEKISEVRELAQRADRGEPLESAK